MLRHLNARQVLAAGAALLTTASLSSCRPGDKEIVKAREMLDARNREEARLRYQAKIEASYIKWDTMDRFGGIAMSLQAGEIMQMNGSQNPISGSRDPQTDVRMQIALVGDRTFACVASINSPTGKERFEGKLAVNDGQGYNKHSVEIVEMNTSRDLSTVVKVMRALEVDFTSVTTRDRIDMSLALEPFKQTIDEQKEAFARLASGLPEIGSKGEVKLADGVVVSLERKAGDYIEGSIALRTDRLLDFSIADWKLRVKNGMLTHVKLSDENPFPSSEVLKFLGTEQTTNWALAIIQKASEAPLQAENAEK